MNLKENKLIKYLIEAKQELKKVTWPTKKETIKNTMLVIGISIGVAIFLGSLDYLFNWIVELILT